MKNVSVQEGSAAIMHAVMIGSNEGDRVVIAAATPEKLKRAFDDLVGGKFDPNAVERVAICDADLAGLMQMEARNG
jgi:heterodisulfide reductase subunit A-like polyferredoxin